LGLLPYYPENLKFLRMTRPLNEHQWASELILNVGLLRTAAVIALWAGAAGSVGLMLYAGHRVGAPRLLRGLFAMWVVSPFVMLAVGYVMSKRWSVLTRATLYGVTPVVAVAFLASFGSAWLCGP